MYRRRASKQSGSVLLTATLLSAFVGSMLYFVPQLMERFAESNEHDRYLFEAKQLSRDLIETTKYLLTYEKAFYLDQPLRMEPNRLEAVKELWSKGLTASSDPSEASTSNKQWWVCGGFSESTAAWIGRNAFYVKSASNPSTGSYSRAFCGDYLRDARYDSDTFEKFVTQGWTLSIDGRTPILERVTGKPGVYRLTLDFRDRNADGTIASRITPNAANILELNTGQRLLNDKTISIDHAEVHVDFLMPTAGYKASATERHLKIKSVIAFSQKVFGSDGIAVLRGRSVAVGDTEALMLVPTTARDFALFLPYTTNGVWQKGGTGLNTDVELSPDSEIHGRTYFNGKLVSRATGGDLSDLPTFYDSVVLSESLEKRNGSGVIERFLGTKQDITVLRQRFKKGIIPFATARRYLMSCDTQDPKMIHMTRISCNGSADSYIEENLKATNNESDGIATIGPSTRTGACATETSGPAAWGNGRCFAEVGIPSACNNPTTPCDGRAPASAEQVVVNGYKDLRIDSRPYAFVISPVGKLSLRNDMSAAMNIYGTIFGGAVQRLGSGDPANIRFYSVNNWRNGLPGMDPALEAENLESRNGLASVAQGGVTVPLTSLPLIWSSEDSMR